MCVSHSVMSDSLWPTRLLCPWDSPGKNTAVACYSLLQGIFLTQGLNPGLLHYGQILYSLSRQGSPYTSLYFRERKGEKTAFQFISVRCCKRGQYTHSIGSSSMASLDVTAWMSCAAGRWCSPLCFRSGRTTFPMSSRVCLCVCISCHSALLEVKSHSQLSPRKEPMQRAHSVVTF